MPAKIVLLADVGWLVRWSLKQRLEQDGYQILEAETGRAVFRRFQDHPEIAAVLLDARLPDLDSFSILRRIKESDPACQVILLTSMRTPEMQEQAIRWGAHSVESKPFDLEKVASHLEEALRATPA